MNYRAAMVIAATISCLGAMAAAQVTYSGQDEADAFVATGSPSNPDGADLTGLNFGDAGILVVAPAVSGNGEFQSLLKFNLADAVAQFNSNFGAGEWKVIGISLTLTSNYGTSGEQPYNAIFPAVSGGRFVIEWLADNDWMEGTGTPNLPTTDGVTYDSLPGLLSGANEILGTNLYTPPGDNVAVTYPLPLTTNLVAAVAAGGDITLLFYAADDQIGYLFNSDNYGRGNEPLIQISATSVLPMLAGVITNGVFQLSGSGSSQTIYQIQANTNLDSANWITIGTVTADGNGNLQFHDFNATNAQCFYQLSQ